MTDCQQRLRTAYESYDQEYNELCDTWRALDQKAQGSLQIAGVMIALMAGFATKTCEPLLSDGPIGKFVMVLNGLSFASLWGSAMFALWALWVQRVSHSPRGTGWCDIDTFAARHQLDQHLAADILGRQLAEWRQTNKDVWGVNESKARYLLWSQRSLAVASSAVTASAVSFLMGQFFK